MAYLATKEHKEWAMKVKQRDKMCIVCHQKEKLVAHHLIPKEFEETRSNVNNGVALCFRHHMRFGHQISPHSHGSILFAIFLMKHKPEVIKWVSENWKE